MRHARSPSQQSGAAMLLVVLLLVGVLGLLGLVVDLGRLRITQQQMLAGCEHAVLEGLRFKDLEGDAARRQRTRDAIRRHWDDDLDPDRGNRLGLGPGSLPIVAEARPLGGVLAVPGDGESQHWRPGDSFATNPDNAPHGDVVAGTFRHGNPSPENDRFERSDFEPVPRGSSAASLAAAPALLVRLRRTGDRLPLDQEAGVSSTGPREEWLWARGSAWREPGPSESNASRATGWASRATAIAAAEPALLVAAGLDPDLQLAPFALLGSSGSAWEGTPPGNNLTLETGPDGLLRQAGVEQGLINANTVRRVGSNTFPDPGSRNALVTTNALLVVPVYVPTAGVRQVAGFALATVTVDRMTVQVTRQPAAVLPANASAVSPAALDARLALAASATLRAAHQNLREPVLAPVLRR